MKKIKGKPHMENQEEFIKRQLYNFSDTKMDKPKHMNNDRMVSYDNPKKDWEILYKSMTPFEKGTHNANERKKIKISGTTFDHGTPDAKPNGHYKPDPAGPVDSFGWDLWFRNNPSSMVRAPSYTREWFEDQQKKGEIPIEIDFDKFMDEMEDFELGGDPDARLKKKRMDDMILSNALQKVDMAMSGIMSTLNLKNGGVVDFAKYRKSKEPAGVKQLNLADYFKIGMRVADLTPSEKLLVNDLLKRTLGKNPK